MAADQDNPPGDKVGGDIDGSSDKTITDLLLGVVNWWCMKSGKTEVVNLVMRHFEHEEVYNSSLILSDFWAWTSLPSTTTLLEDQPWIPARIIW